MTRPKNVSDPTTDLPMETLVALGYRKTSNAYCMVSRIDRPDWLRVIAASMGRSVMDFRNEDGNIRGSWADYYRHNHTKDSLVVSADIIQSFPTSDFDPIGYILRPGEVVPATPTDDEIRALWREQGGSFHGPNIETGTMPESKLLPFLRRLLGGTEELNGNSSTLVSGAFKRVG